jgi:hypothetical protein
MNASWVTGLDYSQAFKMSQSVYAPAALNYQAAWRHILHDSTVVPRLTTSRIMTPIK